MFPRGIVIRILFQYFISASRNRCHYKTEWVVSRRKILLLRCCLSLPLQGCVTTPNSPSLQSRSLTLGPSLSLGNISGVSMKSDMKKRRAPPPPSPGLLGQDKVSEKASLSSQADLQKKKRRAPAPPPPQPPPPSPVVPSRKEDKEENRKSTVGEWMWPALCMSGMPALTYSC